MSDQMRNALADKLKKYDETKKLLREWENGESASGVIPSAQVLSKVLTFVREYVLILSRDGQVAPYLAMNFVEEILVLVLGRDLRFRLGDLNLSEVVKVVQEVPAREDDK